MNPFLHTRYESPIYFCNRDKETKDLLDSIHADRSITLYSIRRLGKTGLIKHVFHELTSKNKRVIPIYVDIYPTRSEAEFVNLLVSSVLSRIEQNQDSFLRKTTKFFGKYRPTFSIDNITGNPSISLDIRTDKEVKVSLDTLFNLIAEQKKKIVIAIDEFQQINEYQNTKLPALLRSYIQSIKGLSFIFSGSKRNLLLHMFSSPKEPLFHSTQLYPLHKIDPIEYKKFIQFHFKQGLKKISSELVEDILYWTKNHTYYTQYFCHRLYETSEKKIDKSSIAQLKFTLYKEFEQVYYNYKNLLTTPQWSLLRAIGKEEIIDAPTSKSFIQKYFLGAHSTVRQSLSNLEDNELIYHHVNPTNKKKEYQIYDVFFSRWLEEMA